MEQESLFDRGRKYWIGVAAEDHVALARAGGFAQFCHGRLWPVRRLAKGDGVVFYSSRRVAGEEEPSRSFTAIAEVLDEAPYQVALTGAFHPYRRHVRFLPARKVSLASLMHDLAFTKNKHWSLRLRIGFMEITAADFEAIARAMRAHLAGPRMGGWPVGEI